MHQLLKGVKRLDGTKNIHLPIKPLNLGKLVQPRNISPGAISENPQDYVLTISEQDLIQILERSTVRRELVELKHSQ